MAERGWRAKGLLRPLWQDYPGKRDGLAIAVGTTGNTLSAINSGRRPLGVNLGSRLAEALGVGLAELGAPPHVIEGPGARGLVDRLEDLEKRDRLSRRAERKRVAALAALTTEVASLRAEVASLRSAVHRLAAEPRRSGSPRRATGGQL